MLKDEEAVVAALVGGEMETGLPSLALRASVGGALVALGGVEVECDLSSLARRGGVVWPAVSSQDGPPLVFSGWSGWKPVPLSDSAGWKFALQSGSVGASPSQTYSSASGARE